MRLRSVRVGYKLLILGLILSIAILTSSCDTVKKARGGAVPVDAAIRSGTQGLTMTFVKNAPQDSVYEDTVFPLGILLNNKGAETIDLGYLSVALEEEYAAFVTPRYGPDIFEIEGVSSFNQRGGEEFIQINAKSKRVGAQSEKHPTDIRVTACYPYKTVLGASVCVDTDLFGLRNRAKSCVAEDQSFSGQGAPVAITGIETKMLPGEDEEKVIPQFIIHVQNKGNGEVLSLVNTDIENACTSAALSSEDFNRIKITADLSGMSLECKGGASESSIVRLREKKDVVRCTLTQGIPTASDPYTSLLHIELEYGYTFTISKNIIIEKGLEY